MATLGTFTPGQVLTAAELNDIGTYSTYTPTFGGFTLGNGTITARFTKINKLVHCFGAVTLGSTSSMAGALDVDLPATAADGVFFEPSPCYFFNNTTIFWGFAINISTTRIRLVAQNASGTYVSNSDTSATVPFTWASGHSFYWNHVYRGA
jgi:hypothetical protein